MIEVWVPGLPRTKGSVRAQGRGGRIVRSDTDPAGRSESERWARLIAASVPAAGLVGPVTVRLDFWLPVADVTAAGSGDVDKLARNVLDALTRAGAYGDDVQVKRLEVDKWPARAPYRPGLLLQVEPWTIPDRMAHAGAWRAMQVQGLV